MDAWYLDTSEFFVLNLWELSLFFMMKLMVLSINVNLCNTSGFVTSGSKTNSHFRNLNLQKGLNLSQILLEVYETLQAYSACPNTQKSQRWPTSIFYSFQDNNTWRLRNVTFGKNTNTNGKLFVFYIPFLNTTYI